MDKEKFMKTDYTFGLILRGKLAAFEELKAYIIENFMDSDLRPITQKTSVGKIDLVEK